MAENNTNIVYVRRNAANQWVVGMPTDALAIPNVTDAKALKSFSLTRQIAGKHEKDADDITRVSVYADVSSTGNLTLCYTKGQKPEPGDVIKYTDDAGKVRALQVMSVGVEYASSNTVAMCPISVEHYDGWEDDASKTTV